MVSFLHLSQVAEVISFHFEIEDFVFIFRIVAIGNEIIVQNILWQKKKNRANLQKSIDWYEMQCVS